MNKTAKQIVSTLCLGLAACGDAAIQESASDMDPTPAREAMRCVETRIGEIDDEESTTLSCDEGGTVTVVVPEDSLTASRELGERIYSNCVVNGVVLNGELRLAKG